MLDSHDGPVVVLECAHTWEAGHDRASGEHARRVFRSARLAQRCDVTEAIAHASADATVDPGDWLFASTFITFALEVTRSWLAGSWTALQPLPLFRAAVMPDTAFDVQAELLAARNAYGADSAQWQVLHELFHACCAIESFGRSRRRGLLDEALLRVHKATRLVRDNDPRDDGRIDLRWQCFREEWT